MQLNCDILYGPKWHLVLVVHVEVVMDLHFQKRLKES